MAQHPIKNKWIFLLLSTFLGSATVLSPAPRKDIRGELTVNDWSRYGSIHLSLDRTRFEWDEPIKIRFRIENSGYRIMRIYPSPETWRTFQVMVLDGAGREVQPKPSPLKINRRNYKTREIITLEGENVKEIMLHPGEVFEKTVYLNDYFQLKPGSEYRLVGYVYPDARYDFFVRSKNSYEIHINEEEQKRYVRMKSANPLVDNHLQLTPEETVYLFLSAEMKENWKNYLKYLDLERFITVYDRFSTRYALASPGRKPVILDEFQRYLTSRPADRLVQFKINDSVPERNPAGEINHHARWSVHATGVRQSGGFSTKYEYTYTLEKASTNSDGFWKIIHVQARVME